MPTRPDRPNDHARRASIARRWAVAAFAAIACLAAAAPAAAQNPTNGRALYFAEIVGGRPSCSGGSCHGTDWARNLRKINNGANRPDVIAAAITNVPAMNFLSGRLNYGQLSDLAAYIAQPAAAGPVARAELNFTSVDFGTISLGATSELRQISLRNIGTAPLYLSNITVSNPEFTRPTMGTCAPTAVIPPNGSCTLVLDFTPQQEGPRSGILTFTHNGLGSPTSNVSLSGTGYLAPESRIKTMVEYYHLGLDYYFMTSRENEIKLLDGRPEWMRTGQSFKVLRSPVTGATSVMRFYFDRIARNHTRGTHFYAVEFPEKEGLIALNPINAQLPGLPYFEGIDSYAFAPLVAGIDGSCAEGQQPVYRVFRGQINFPDDPNHRFTTDINIYNTHVAQGWDPEGIKMCIPVE